MVDCLTLFHLSTGSIDEVEQMVHMTWVQPRVLDLNQVNENTLNCAFGVLACVKDKNVQYSQYVSFMCLAPLRRS